MAASCLQNLIQLDGVNSRKLSLVFASGHVQSTRPILYFLIAGGGGGRVTPWKSDFVGWSRLDALRTVKFNQFHAFIWNCFHLIDHNIYLYNLFFAG